MAVESGKAVERQWKGPDEPEPPELRLAVDEAVILLHLPLPLVSVSIVMERERQQNDSLVNN